jgi:transcriptional regulator with XRE-family HTH domain
VKTTSLANSPQKNGDLARLGAAVRARRLALGLSQQQLADMLGVTRDRISATEVGHIGTMRTFLKIATALGMDVVAIPRDDPANRRLVTAQRESLSSAHRRVRRRPKPAHSA